MTEGSPVPAPLGAADPAATPDAPDVTATTGVEYTVDVATAPPPVVAQTAAYASSPHVVAAAAPSRGLPTTGTEHAATLGGASAVLLLGVLVTRFARRSRPVPARVRA